MAKKRPAKKSIRKGGQCPCGGPAYESCCAPLHGGTPPKDAEQLMRSRFSAFVRKDGAYIWRTLHSEHDAKGGDEATFVQSIAKTSRRYTELRVLDTAPPDSDGAAMVLFAARFDDGLRKGHLVELSVFLDEGGWKYLAGEIFDFPEERIEGLTIATLAG